MRQHKIVIPILLIIGGFIGALIFLIFLNSLSHFHFSHKSYSKDFVLDEETCKQLNWMSTDPCNNFRGEK